MDRARQQQQQQRYQQQPQQPAAQQQRYVQQQPQGFPPQSQPQGQAANSGAWQRLVQDQQAQARSGTCVPGPQGGAAASAGQLQGQQAQQAQQQQQLQPAPQHTVPAYLHTFYDIIGKIGEGTYGVVYLARNREPRPRMLAVKTFKPGKEGDGVSPTAIREIMLLREISHENIVRLDSVHLNRQEPCLSLAFDYAEHDLYEMIKFHRDKVHGPIDLYTVKSLMWQVLNGLSVMHQNWIIHRDMKPSNVLVMGEGEEQGRVKIADFGLARFFQAPLRPLSDNGVVVTIWYRSPELLLGAKHYTVAVDMWAAGCIFAELLTLRPLFQGEEKKQPGNAFQADQLDKIFRILGHPNTQAWPELENLQHWRDNTENVRVRKTWHPEAHVGQEQRLEEYLAEHSGLRRALRGSPAVDLLMRMVDYNPLTRITAAEALEHEWFRQDPLFGANSFVHRGRAVVQYPRRVKYSSTAPNVPVHPTTSTAAEAGGTQSAIPSQGVITGSSRGGETAAGVPARVRSRPDLEKFVKPGKRKHDFGPGFR